jgi:segregation and condensation protein B
MKNLKEIIKATLFVAGEGIEIEDFSEKFDVSVNEIKKAIEELKAESDDFSGIQIIQYKNKIQLASNSKYADYISAVLNPIREKALTKAMLETLSIIAYKQPITRMEIEDIRRVSCDYALNILEEHKMIEVVGRKDAVGKPLLYGTTEDFLKRFGLLNLEQLPKLQELLERIAVIREEERKSDNLYNDFKLQDLSAENSKNKADDVNEFTEPYEPTNKTV